MGNDKLIYIVDDDVTHLHLADKITKSAGYDTMLFLSAEEVISKLSSGCIPDLILLDIEMPGLSGLDAIKRIKKIKDCADSPVIFLTGMEGDDVELEGLKAGAVDYIKKPFVRDIFLARIKNHIDVFSNIRKIKGQSDKSIPKLNEKRMALIEKELSVTEVEIAKLVAFGYNNNEIAQMQSYSVGYIKQVVHSIFIKLGFENRSELRRYLRDDNN